MPSIGLADEDANENLFAVEDAHGLLLFPFASGPARAAPLRAPPLRRRGIRAASRRRSRTPIRQRSFLEELQRLVVEGGVRREAAEDAGRERQAKRRRDELCRHTHVHDGADEERAEEIDGERAPRDIRCRGSEAPSRRGGSALPSPPRRPGRSRRNGSSGCLPSPRAKQKTPTTCGPS